MAESAKSALPVTVAWGKETSLKVNNDLVLSSSSSIIRHIARSSGSCNLYGLSILEKTEVSHIPIFLSVIAN